MLSYRHAFHAGNYADLLKHIVLSKCIDYLLKKDAPITYIDSHAGAGSYDLGDAMTQKTGEYKKGVYQIPLDFLEEVAKPYAELIAQYRETNRYPGSPEIAKNLLRRKDLLYLFELHPTDFNLLNTNIAQASNVRTFHKDGYQHLLPILPTKGRRALILIDPSYEIKTEYQQVVNIVADAHKRMPNATILVWYPVVKRDTIEKMIAKIKNKKVKDVWRYELGIKEDDYEYGMTSSGMLTINEPWTLHQEMQKILPALAQQVSKQGVWQLERVCDE